MKIVEQFAEYCGLADSEKAWLIEEVVVAVRSKDEGHSHDQGCDHEHPSIHELDAFDEVVRGLLEKRGTQELGEGVAPESEAEALLDSPAPGAASRSPIAVSNAGQEARSAASRSERGSDASRLGALRAKLARGCLRGIEHEEMFLTDETVVAAVDALHEAGAFEPEDAHLLATFLGQFRSSAQSDVKHLAAVCEGLVRQDSLGEVHRLDLVLAMLACAELTLPLRTAVLEAVAGAKTLPPEVGEEILVRVLNGANLYKPYWYESANDYMDARPSWVFPSVENQRQALILALGELCGQLTPENRERAHAELDDLDDVLDWLDTEDGITTLEAVAVKMAEQLPELAGDGELIEETGHSLYPPELRPLEPAVQQACDEAGAPRKSAEVLLTGLGYVLDELMHTVVDPAAFARSILAGDGDAEATLLDICGHVLDCSLQDSLNQVYVPLSQLADLSDEDLERLREMALAARDALMRGAADGTISADLVELLAPFESRTAARLNRVSDEELSFSAARLLTEMGLPRDEVARLASAAWDQASLEIAGDELSWVRQLITDHASLFESELVAAVRNGPSRIEEKPERYN